MLETSTLNEGYVSDSILGSTIKSNPDASRLNDTWALWVMFQQGKVGKEHWQANQTKAHEVHTIGDFWRLHNHIHPASRLLHADYSLFRRGVTPAWEDPTCKNGGRWIAKCSNFIDESWLNVQLSLIGESFGTVGPSICGAVFSARRGGVKIALWLSSSDEAIIEEAGKFFRASLTPEQISSLVFESFNTADQKH
jgi:translation initiation factor 4E